MAKTSLTALANGKKSAVRTLAKQIQGIKNTLKTHAQVYYTGKKGSAAVTGDYQYVNLSEIANSDSIFGTDLFDDFNVERTRHMNMAIDNYVTLENGLISEEETVQFTYFIVSLRDEIGSAFDPDTGLLYLNANDHYYRQGGIVMLNKKFFNIHKVKRFVLSNHGTSLASPSAQTQHGTDKRFYMRQSVNKIIINPQDPVRVLRTALDPSKTYYALLFNNDSALDGEWGRWDINVVNKYKH